MAINLVLGNFWLHSMNHTLFDFKTHHTYLVTLATKGSANPGKNRAPISNYKMCLPGICLPKFVYQFV